MTVEELIEKLSALPDKTARVVKSPGPWDLNEPSQIYERCNSQFKPLIRTQSTSFIFDVQ